MKTVDCTTLKNGALVDLVNDALEKAVNNINDESTNAKDVREIDAKIIFKPDEERRTANVRIEVKTKLSGTRPTQGIVFLDEQDGKGIICEDDYRQPDLDGLAEDADKNETNVFTMPKSARG